MAEIMDYQERMQRLEELAEKRFRARAQEREQVAKSLEAEGSLEADARERVNVRVGLINPADGLAIERIIGTSDLIGVNYLEFGLTSARSVCRIQVRNKSGRVLGYGTGFMVSPSLMLTNNHVLDSEDNSLRSLADFNFEDDVQFLPKDFKTFPLNPERFFYTNAELDFTLVAVQPRALDGTELSAFGCLRLRDESGKALLGEYVTIIQHPEGGTKQITIRENQVVDLPDNFMHYLTDTKPGSSGSPVFNDQWDVVALHHAGVKKRDGKGRVLAINGKVWKPAMGEEKIAWKANEGVRISSIARHLYGKMAEFTYEQQELLKETLAGAAAAAAAGGAAQPVVTEMDLEWYKGSTGYAPDFLGPKVPLPQIPAALKKDLAPLKTGTGHELKYTNFSVVVRKSRGLALYTAVNIDGESLKDIKREQDKWYFDPRLDRRYQYGPELYERNDLDRGHLVRRLDPVWGKNATEAGEDTFHFTNCAPQHKALNQKTWQQLEDYILKNAKKHDLKVTVFTGPVFRDDDMLYRGAYQIPAEFWKVVVLVKDDGKLSATAYLQTQKNLLAELEVEFAYGKYKTYQVAVTRIEALTGLDFRKLRGFDPLGEKEGVLARFIGMPEDIRI